MSKVIIHKDRYLELLRAELELGETEIEGVDKMTLTGNDDILMEYFAEEYDMCE